MWDFTGAQFLLHRFYTRGADVSWHPRSGSGNQNARIKQSLDITYHFIWYTQYWAVLYITMIISPPLLKSSSRYGIPTIGRYGVLVLQFYEFRESCTEDSDSDYWGGVCVSNCCGDTQC